MVLKKVGLKRHHAAHFEGKGEDEKKTTGTCNSLKKKRIENEREGEKRRRSKGEN